MSVLDDDHLVFADIRSPGTVANIRVNPSVEINVVDPFVRKGYRFKGHAEVVEAGAEFDRLLAFFSRGGLSDAPRRIRTIVVVRVEQARPLISPGYDRETDESAMRERWTRYYLGDEDPTRQSAASSIFIFELTMGIWHLLKELRHQTHSLTQQETLREQSC